MKTFALVIIAIGAVASLITLILKRVWSKEQQDKKTVEETDMSDPSSLTSTFDKLNRCIIVGALLLLAGCARVVIHPIEQTDIIRMEKGETIEAPKDGYFLSELYIKEVMKAKVE